MEIGPDGSLCRITSSAKDCSTNNLQIVKVSEDELLKYDTLPYKLVLLGEQNDSESLSEKSDEEMFETESPDIELSTESFKNKNVKTHEVVEECIPQNGNVAKKSFNKRYRANNMKRKRNNYNSSGARNFNSSGKVTKTYNRTSSNTSSTNIEPWINPPQILNTLQEYPFAIYSPFASINTSVNSSIDKPVGLLGDSPFSHFPQQFQSNSQNNNFGRDQSYWNGDYSNNYQRSIQDSSIPGQSIHKKYYHQNKYRKNKRGKDFWKKQKETQKERRKSSGNFNYRKQ